MKRDLGTLTILHYIYGVLVCLGGAAMLLFIVLGVFLNSEVVQSDRNPPPAEVGGIFQALGWFFFALLEVFGILIMLSGRWIANRRNRNASLVIAGFCCLSFPIGTALGVYTFVSLFNEDVKQEYTGPPALAA